MERLDQRDVKLHTAHVEQRLLVGLDRIGLAIAVSIAIFVA